MPNELHSSWSTKNGTCLIFHIKIQTYIIIFSTFFILLFLLLFLWWRDKLSHLNTIFQKIICKDRQMIRTDCWKPLQGNIILYTISQESPEINQDVSEYESKTDKNSSSFWKCSQGFTLDRKGSPIDLDDGTVEEVFTKHTGINGGRHEDNPDFRVHLNDIPQHHQKEVSLHRKRVRASLTSQL